MLDLKSVFDIYLASQINENYGITRMLFKAFEHKLVCCLLSTDNQSFTDGIPTNDIAFVGICRHLQVEYWYAVDYDGILYRDSILYPGSLVRYM